MHRRLLISDFRSLTDGKAFDWNAVSGQVYSVYPEKHGEPNEHAFLKSRGIGHATKSKIELGVADKDGFFDDIKVWNADPAK